MKCETGAKPDVVEVMMRLSQMLNRSGNEKVVYEVSACDLTRLHGILWLGVHNPEFQVIANNCEKPFEQFRAFCRSVWIELGLSPDEADLVDRFMEHVEQEREHRGDLIIEHSLMERFKGKYGCSMGLNLVVFYLNFKSGGPLKAKGELPERTFYKYRKKLYDDGFLTDEEIQAGGNARWVK